MHGSNPTNRCFKRNNFYYQNKTFDQFAKAELHVKNGRLFDGYLIYKKLASEGNAKARSECVRMCKHDLCVDQDFARTLNIYAIAAENGSIEALNYFTHLQTDIDCIVKHDIDFEVAAEALGDACASVALII